MADEMLDATDLAVPPATPPEPTTTETIASHDGQPKTDEPQLNAALACAEQLGGHRMRTKITELLLADMNTIHAQLDSSHDLPDSSAREMVKIHLEQLLTIYLSLKDRVSAL